MRRLIFRVAAIQAIKPLRPQFVYRFCTIKQERYEFKTETKKILDIMARSLYTDKDVFLRELLSNASDALEKQRFISQLKGQESADLFIKVDLDEQKRTITIEDTGVGMTKEEMIDNLGTIAKSGSKQFLEEDGKDMSKEKIIGQFGVGFYSSFVVGDSVEVISKSEKSGKTHQWISDGSGSFTISEVDNAFQGRGTKIIVHLKPEVSEYVQAKHVKDVVNKYSNFISFPIQINGEQQNLVQAIWTRSKQELTRNDYEAFFEYLTNSKVTYKYVLHYSTDAPLAIKALIYVPSQHNERLGVAFEDHDIHLYCKKILIKKNCRELIANYLRFIKGVVDCEDLPLNISREGYQDSQMIGKLKNIITSKIIRHIEEESRKDPEQYLKWYGEFQNFVKEGVASQDEHQQNLIKLLRYQTNKSEKFITLEEYIQQLPAGESKIYFLLSTSRQSALTSPYLESFQGSQTPVILIHNHADELVFKQINTLENKQFVNLESESSIDSNKNETQTNAFPKEDVTSFSLWLKNELAPTISIVQVSKRLRTSPAVVSSQLSSGMRQVMSAMGQQNDELQKNMTLEINLEHDILVNLNKFRKTNSQVATLCAKQLLDNCLIQVGLLQDHKSLVDRSNKIMQILLDNDIIIREKGYREKVQQQQSHKDDAEETEVVIDQDGNPKVVRKHK